MISNIWINIRINVDPCREGQRGTGALHGSQLRRQMQQAEGRQGWGATQKKSVPVLVEMNLTKF